jgi:hypothetical protein
MPLVLAALVPVVGLFLRARWAWFALLAIDVAAALAAIAVGLPDVADGGWVMFLVAAVPLILAGLLLGLREKRERHVQA